MINKELLKIRFEKSLDTYEKNAQIQKEMAEKLCLLLPAKKYKNIFEIGCGSGVLTRMLQKNVEFENYFANDIVENAKKYVNTNFVSGDIDTLKFDNKFNLIISNATMQWSSDLEKTTKNIMQALAPKGLFAFSTFGVRNMFEIKEVFKVGLHYFTLDELMEKFKLWDIAYLKEEIKTMEFQSPTDVFRHLKYTGVNAFEGVKLTKTKLKIYETKFKNNLTYNPVYVILKNRN